MDAYFKKLWWLTKRSITVFKSQNVKKKKNKKLWVLVYLRKVLANKAIQDTF